MKKLMIWAMALCIVMLSVLPAQAAADLEVGAKVFKANCVGCHLGGKNTLVADKNLTLQALQDYHMDSPEAIIAQVTQGKAAMPSFKARLKPEEIESVAAYVLDQAQKGWGKKA